jgi:AcrR family transcriptional regulator
MDRQTQEKTRVKNAITDALFSIMEHKSIDDISITELTEAAGVSRMAYYRNFDSKLDIISYFFEKTLNEMLESLGNDCNFWTLEYGRAFFQLMKKYRDCVLLLDHSGFSKTILKYFNLANEELAGDMSSKSIERYRLYYTAGAAYNGLIQWLEGGCQESIDDMVHSLAKFIDIKDA